MPRPPARRSSVRSPCTKRSKMCGSSAAGMPMPASCTSKHRARRRAGRRVTSMRRPAGVYLIALVTRLVTTCSMRTASPSTQASSTPQAAGRAPAASPVTCSVRCTRSNDRRQVDRLARQQDLAGDHPAHVQQVVHHVGQVAGLAGDDGAGLGGARRCPAAPPPARRWRRRSRPAGCAARGPASTRNSSLARLAASARWRAATARSVSSARSQFGLALVGHVHA